MTRKLDIITLRGLSASGRHGVFDSERESEQPFRVDISLWVDTTHAAETDDIDHTVSYADIAEEAVAVLSGPSVYLLETLAQRVADAALRHERVEGVEVTVHKPMAPLAQQFSDVCVTIRRGSCDEGPVCVEVPADAEESRTEVSPHSAPLPPLPPVAASLAHLTGEADTRGASSAPAPTKTESAPAAHERAGEEPKGRRLDYAMVLPPRRTAAPRARGIQPSSKARRVVLALGGNIGNVPVTLASAIGRLIDCDGFEVDEVSPLLRTRAVIDEGAQPQPDYWNAVVLGRTSLDAESLLACCQKIEADLGRVRHEHWGPRTVDIDLVSVEGTTCHTPTLTLPHPYAHRRAFVLVPWNMADPHAQLVNAHGVATPVAQLALAAPDRSGIIDAITQWLDDPASVMEESDQLMSSQEDEPMSKLDLLPPESKIGLRPADSGTDVLWKKLWKQWQSSPLANDDAGARENAEASEQVVEADEEEASAVLSDAHNAAHAPARELPEPPVASTREDISDTSEIVIPPSLRRRRSVRWVPVRSDRDAQEVAEEHNDKTVQASAPALPEWDFQSTSRTRIIDDAEEAPVRRRSILDPHLADKFPHGPLPDDETTTTSVVRGMTVRPTVTGQIPVIRRNERHTQ